MAKQQPKMLESERSSWNVWKRQVSAEFVKALIHAHGGDQGDVRWFAARAVAYADALEKELLAPRPEVPDTEKGEREDTRQGNLPFTVVNPGPR